MGVPKSVRHSGNSCPRYVPCKPGRPLLLAPKVDIASLMRTSQPRRSLTVSIDGGDRLRIHFQKLDRPFADADSVLNKETDELVAVDQRYM